MIDVTERMEAEPDDGFQSSVDDVKNALESQKVKKLEPNSIVVLITGFEDKFGTEAYHDPIPGFSGEAVEYLFAQGAKLGHRQLRS